jgi:hypothetical protein
MRGKIMTIEITTTKGQKNLTGCALGKKYRRNYHIDDFDDSDEIVFIHFSPKVFSLNYDFFKTMFGPSMRKLGPKFSTHYQFYSGNKMRDHISEFITKFQIQG